MLGQVRGSSGSNKQATVLQQHCLSGCWSIYVAVVDIHGGGGDVHCLWFRVSALSHAHTHTRTHAHKHTHAHTNAHASTHTCTHTDTCIHKHIYALTQQHTHTLCDVLSVLVTGCGTLRNIPAALNTQPAGRTHHWWLDTQTHAHTHI